MSHRPWPEGKENRTCYNCGEDGPTPTVRENDEEWCAPCVRDRFGNDLADAMEAAASALAARESREPAPMPDRYSIGYGTVLGGFEAYHLHRDDEGDLCFFAAVERMLASREPAPDAVAQLVKAVELRICEGHDILCDYETSNGKLRCSCHDDDLSDAVAAVKASREGE